MPKQNQNNSHNFGVIPLIGLEFIRLGESEIEVREALNENGIGFNETYDPFCWELDEPWCTLWFVASPTKKLIQIVSTCDSLHVNGEPIVGRSLDEALLVLGVRTFDDTLWSIVDIDLEFLNGVPISDSERPTKCDSTALLDGGTLWIKSLGIGLCVDCGSVGALAIRRQGDVPSVGCGPLKEDTLLDASEPELKQKLNAARALKKPVFEARLGSNNGLMRTILLIAAIAVFSLPALMLFNNYQRWSHTTSVNGTVTGTKQEGPFVIELTVEYLMPNESMRTITINANYTTARKIGDEVELEYPAGDPKNALTRIEVRDAIIDEKSLYLLLIAPVLAIGLLALRARLSNGRRTC